MGFTEVSESSLPCLCFRVCLRVASYLRPCVSVKCVCVCVRDCTVSASRTVWSVPTLVQGHVLTLKRPLWLTEVKIPPHVWRLQREEAVVSACGFCPVLFLKLKKKKKTSGNSLPLDS